MLAQYDGSDPALRALQLKAGWHGRADTLHGQGQDGADRKGHEVPLEVCLRVCVWIIVKRS